MLNNKFFDIFLFIVLFIIYYLTPFKLNVDLGVFLTVATFLFAIFAGFFISRQGNRYSNIRDQISQFDGELSAMYRQLGHIDKKAQKQLAKIIKGHYLKILKNKAWDYNFIHKSAEN